MSRTRKHKVDVDGRECSQCDEYKLWDEYYAGAGAHGKDTRCKGCMCGKTRSRNQLPEVQAVEKDRWKARWEAAHPGQQYKPRSRRTVEQRKAVQMLRRFGITPEERQLLDERAVFGPGLCDLHGGPETLKYKGGAVRGLSIDHDHSCGRHAPEVGCRHCIRGVVCCDCNRNIIRKAEQFPALIVRFQDYLDRRPLLSLI